MAVGSKRGHRLKLVLLGLVVIGAGVLVDWHQVEPYARRVQTIFAAKAPAPAQSPKVNAVPVSAAQARTGDFPVVLSGLGTVQPYNTVLVRTRVDGQIMTLHFAEGQIVQAGDLLAEIDPRPYQASLDQATAKRQQDQATIDNAKRDLGRYQSLAKSDYATRQQLDTQTAMVAQLTAQIASDDASVENAQTQLGYATVRTPITGRAGFRLVDQGNIVNASSQTGIVSIAQIEPISVIFTAPENAVPDIQSGQKATPLDVRAFNSDGTRALADGKLETLNNEIDTASGTVRLKAAFPNKEHMLWPGLSVSTRLTVSVRKDVVLVPFKAVQRSQSGLYVFVIGPDNKVEQRPIKISLSNDSTAVIEDGVKAGDTVVTGGQYRLQAGTLVKTVPDDAKQTSQRDT